MGKKILDSKALYVVLSILIAITMWYYVTSMDGNQRSNPINNIPITFVGEEQLVSRGLMIAGDPPTASITVKATPTVLAQLTNDSVELVVDVSSIDKASEYTLAYTVKLPSNISASQAYFLRLPFLLFRPPRDVLSNPFPLALSGLLYNECKGTESNIKPNPAPAGA